MVYRPPASHSKPIAGRWRPSARRRLPKDHAPVFILGHQKSGTSAIAGLLGELTGLEVTIDLRQEIRDLMIPRIAAGEASIDQLIRRNRAGFAAPIVKHPNLTLIHDHLRSRFPRSRFVFVVRDPRDNIRSILDRLEIEGRATRIEDARWEQIPTPWRLILGAEGGAVDRPCHLDALADRWNAMARGYWDNATTTELIRYEDFMVDKAAAIGDLAARLRLPQARDIDAVVDHPFQPAGAHRGIGFADFFGADNLTRIEARCHEFMARFGYEPTS